MKRHPRHPHQPRRMWLYTRGDTGAPTEPWSVSSREALHTLPAKPDIPVLVIPLTKETVALLLDRADKAHARGFGFGHPENAVNSTGRLRRALASIGIKVPRS